MLCRQLLPLEESGNRREQLGSLWFVFFLSSGLVGASFCFC
jgi:hypothetical protein